MPFHIICALFRTMSLRIDPSLVCAAERAGGTGGAPHLSRIAQTRVLYSRFRRGSPLLAPRVSDSMHARWLAFFALTRYFPYVCVVGWPSVAAAAGRGSSMLCGWVLAQRSLQHPLSTSSLINVTCGSSALAARCVSVTVGVDCTSVAPLTAHALGVKSSQTPAPTFAFYSTAPSFRRPLVGFLQFHTLTATQQHPRTLYRTPPWHAPSRRHASQQGAR